MIRELENFKAAERWLLRRLRLLVDHADEILHAWEVRTRNEMDTPATVSQIQQPKVVESIKAPEVCDGALALEVGGVTRRPRQLKKKRRMTAAEFDLDIRMRSAARAGAR